MMLITATSALYLAIHFAFPHLANAWAALLSVSASGTCFCVCVSNSVRLAREQKIEKFDDLWRSLREQRKSAALFLLKQGGLVGGVEETLNFFEDLGQALRRKQIDLLDARDHYSDFIIGYWEICFSGVIKAQKNYKEDWENFFPLYEAMKKRDPSTPWTKENLEKFLKAEAGL
jgi:hypothetical protein